MFPFPADDSKGLFSEQTFREHISPRLMSIFYVRDIQVRLTLLKYFPMFCDMFTIPQLNSNIIPELLVGVMDVNDELVASTLRALADLVPILGSATVIGGKRAKHFSDGRPKIDADDILVPQPSTEGFLQTRPVEELQISRPLPSPPDKQDPPLNLPIDKLESLNVQPRKAPTPPQEVDFFSDMVPIISNDHIVVMPTDRRSPPSVVNSKFDAAVSDTEEVGWGDDSDWDEFLVMSCEPSTIQVDHFPGRLHDHQILDMAEFGVENFKSLDEFEGEKFPLGMKPCLLFAGPQFELDPTLKRIKNLLVDAFQREPVSSLRLQGLEHVIMFTCHENKIHMRSYRISLKKSGSRTPRVELEEIGPSMDLSVRRTKLASDDLFNSACKKPKELKVWTSFIGMVPEETCNWDAVCLAAASLADCKHIGVYPWQDVDSLCAPGRICKGKSKMPDLWSGWPCSTERNDSDWASKLNGTGKMELFETADLELGPVFGQQRRCGYINREFFKKIQERLTVPRRFPGYLAGSPEWSLPESTLRSFLSTFGGTITMKNGPKEDF
ncbi:unnamed protein product [Nesidiocoris tenuis]|uniref:Ribosome production factor 2 homolog n=1 Tax=Nesidiocoris tenuis TaxID=355587 RepID=A0A6H5G4M8_9HEMI|nr:unnamed protein product [Nesidiocoris tenuis]